MDINIVTTDDGSELLKRLGNFEHAPKKLYISGSIPSLREKRFITIVGSRMHHPDSKTIINKIMRGLQGYPVVVVSGLALGIDGIAHKAALEYGIPTIAFPGSGLSNIYPASHSALAKSIIESGGALVSEFSPKTQAARWTFPLRNRLMAQCADLVLVIEASERSGTFITARHALESGVTLCAVPHSPLNGHARGTNKLIQDGAHVVLDHTDILELLGIPIEPKEQSVIHLPKDQQRIYGALRKPTYRQELFEHLSMSHDSFTQALSALEIAGYISERMGVISKL